MPNYKRDTRQAGLNLASTVGLLAAPLLPVPLAVASVPPGLLDLGKTIDEGCHGGILCVHTSNRHVNLVKPVTDVAKALKLKWRVGKDQGGRDVPGKESGPKELLQIGHFGQEYVMLAQNAMDLPPNTAGKSDPRLVVNPSLVWYTPAAPGSPVWTDDYSYLMGVFRWGWPFGSGE